MFEICETLHVRCDVGVGGLFSLRRTLSDRLSCFRSEALENVGLAGNSKIFEICWRFRLIALSFSETIMFRSTFTDTCTCVQIVCTSAHSYKSSTYRATASPQACIPM